MEFKILHKKLEVCAFLDTGNFLYEPVSQMPVCILEEETFLKYFHEPLFKMIEKTGSRGHPHDPISKCWKGTWDDAGSDGK